MAKILYGVAGEGFGHAVRSKTIIEHLKKKGHKIHIIAAGNAYNYLKKEHKNITEIDFFNIIYKQNTAKIFLSGLRNTLRFPFKFLPKALKANKIIKQFKPDIIITDFEPVVSYYAKLKNIPIISIDNQHIATEADHEEIIKKNKKAWFWTKFIINFFIIKKDATIITAIVPAKSTAKHFHIIPPILKKEILKTKPTQKDHILVYQTSMSNDELFPTLKQFPDQKFIVYGFGKKKSAKNIIFKQRSDKQFLSDLKSCKAVITNGGFQLIGEAIYLQKPILSIPVKQHFEQILNAVHVHMLGYGHMVEEISEYAIQEFLRNLHEFDSYLAKQTKHKDNKEAFKAIDKEIKELGKK